MQEVCIIVTRHPQGNTAQRQWRLSPSGLEGYDSAQRRAEALRQRYPDQEFLVQGLVPANQPKGADIIATLSACVDALTPSRNTEEEEAAMEAAETISRIKHAHTEQVEFAKSSG